MHTSSVLLGIYARVSALVLFSTMDAMVKWLGESYGPFQMMLFRSTLALVRSVQQRLSGTPVTDAMMPRAQIIAATVPVGKVDEERLKLIRVTEQCLDRAIEQCRAGKHLGDIGWAVQQHAEASGYSVVRDYVGHGIGRRMHEDPQIPNYGRSGLGPKIKVGYVFAVEPMVNQGTDKVVVLKDGWTVVTKDKKCSAHFEHSVAITDW